MEGENKMSIRIVRRNTQVPVPWVKSFPDDKSALHHGSLADESRSPSEVQDKRREKAHKSQTGVLVNLRLIAG